MNEFLHPTRKHSVLDVMEAAQRGGHRNRRSPHRWADGRQAPNMLDGVLKNTSRE
jgi:hypothetical protein